jgi:hypothetical protein
MDDLRICAWKMVWEAWDTIDGDQVKISYRLNSYQLFSIASGPGVHDREALL